MPAKRKSIIPELLTGSQKALLDAWVRIQQQTGDGRTEDDANREAASALLAALGDAAQTNNLSNIQTADWAPVRELLAGLSRSHALQGYSASDTTAFMLSLKQPLFREIQRAVGDRSDVLAEELWTATVLFDALALFTAEVFQRSREDIIIRQQQDMLELSTPVVKLWQGILAIPLIGTLDSARTQVVMETLLQQIVDTGSEIAIIDITGVPTVDTLVAQHLLKTVAATRLMGAECIISGIRPQIAQTIVHLGVELGEVITKASLADAFAVALQRRGVSISRINSKN